MERYELEESREYKVAMVLEDALNNTCFDYKMFAESVIWNWLSISGQS